MAQATAAASTASRCTARARLPRYAVLNRHPLQETAEARDARCADGMLCAMAGAEGRDFGCAAFHCCAVAPSTTTTTRAACIDVSCATDLCPDGKSRAAIDGDCCACGTPSTQSEASAGATLAIVSALGAAGVAALIGAAIYWRRRRGAGAPPAALPPHQRPQSIISFDETIFSDSRTDPAFDGGESQPPPRTATLRQPDSAAAMGRHPTLRRPTQEEGDQEGYLRVGV